MNSLRNYFTSPMKSVSVVSNTTLQIHSSMSNTAVPVPSTSKYKTDGREIIRNMEEVLNSVKKKHKNKYKHKHHHHRKKDTNAKKLETSQELINLSGILNEDEHLNLKPLSEKNGNLVNALQGLVSPTKANVLIRGKKYKPAKKLNKLDKLTKKLYNNSVDLLGSDKHSKFIVENSKCTTNTTTTPLSAVNEVVSKSEKDCIDIPTESDATIAESNEILVETQIKKNAFEFMMDARNKRIGRNSPGKNEFEIDKVENAALNSVKTKRKLFLEEWSQKKGAKKRKLDEASREEYVDYLLTKRATRLKKMILNGNTNTKFDSSSNQIRNKNTNNSSAVNTTKSKKKYKIRKIKNIPSVTSESDIYEVNTEKEDLESIEKLSSPFKKRDSLLEYFPKTISPSTNEKADKKSENTEKEDLEFIEKLSSPIKKRDSLLGYFPKTNSPNTNEKGDKKSSLNRSDNAIAEVSDKCSLRSRPRRSCVGKARYDYDLDESPIKLKQNTAQLELKPKLSKKLKVIEPKYVDEDDDPDVVYLENSSYVDNKLKQSDNIESVKKLAPVFVKTLRKLNVDAKTLEARHAFLMSGVPEKMKQAVAKQKHFEESFEASTTLFPKICHVPQWENENVENVKWENYGIIWIKEELEEKLSVQLQKKKSRSSPKFKFINGTSKVLKNLKTNLIPITPLPQLENKIVLIKNWKNLYEKFPTYKCYNQLREKYRYFSARDTDLYTQQIAESFVVTRRTHSNRVSKLNKNGDDDELPPDSAPNGELLFTDKYKPLSSEQILVNLTPVNILKEFLSSWQDDGRTQRLNDSMNDFDYNIDSNSSTNGNNISNAIVLLGPYSSGKTQAVFALADELNFNVLEINAGMKRTGKKLLQELQEATQSHQIRKDSKGNLVKKYINRMNSKKTDLNGDSSSSSELSSNGKMSLILVEDADITFDQYDAGYIDAIYQLASMSKRPVVIIANNRNCPYLLRLINMNSVEFSAPNALNISKFLTILSLIENCPIDLEEIISLYLFNNMDTRKTILEMQFFIQSGGDRIKSSGSTYKLAKSRNEKYYASPTKRRFSLELLDGNDESILKGDNNVKDNIIYTHNKLFELFTCSQNFKSLIPYPVNLNLLWINLNKIFEISKSLLMSKRKIPKSQKLKIAKNNALSNEIQILNILVEFYENISVATCLSSIEMNDRLILNLEEEISHLLIDNSIQSILKTRQCAYNLFVDNRKKRKNLIPNNANITFNSKAKYLDYEPYLRSICRSEKNRSSLERRGTRFYHYLRKNLRLDTFSTEIFDNACSILMNNTEINNITTVIPELEENSEYTISNQSLFK